MSREYALRIEELNRELKEVREKYLKLKHKTTTNLLQAVKLKQQQNRIETEIACQRTLYFEFVDNLRKRGAI